MSIQKIPVPPDIDYDSFDIPPFEGPEKKLEAEFKVNNELPLGLRSVPVERWSEMLTLIGCTILSSMTGPRCDAYVLSESSLFVYPYKIMIKTCGTISLLNCTDYLLNLAREFCQSEVSFIYFSRRNFYYPDKQPFPHTSFDDEVTYLKVRFPEGEAYVFGPRTGDHWYLFVADFGHPHAYDQTLEIAMTGLDRKVMRQFYMDPTFVNAEKKTRDTGIANIFPGIRIDAHMFDPLGYSMNGLDEEDYYCTVHITPQPECSFVSFETNAPRKEYASLVKQVVSLFKPEAFTVTLFADIVNLCGPDTFKALGSPSQTKHGYTGFSLKSQKIHRFNNGPFNLTFCSFKRDFEKVCTFPQAAASSCISHSVHKDRWLGAKPFMKTDVIEDDLLAFVG